MKNNKKRIVSFSLVIALLAIIAGGTYAFFTDDAEVTNTFTVGDLGITLTEEGWEDETIGHLVPGTVIDKAPTVAVKDGSEKAYVFMYLENNLPDLKLEEQPIISLDMSKKWKRIDDEKKEGKSLYVYVGENDPKKEEAVGPGVALEALFSKVRVNEEATKTELNPTNIVDKNTIVVKAFAHQASNNNTDNFDLYTNAKESALELFHLEEAVTEP